jgi:hypothetical protein
MDQSGTRDFNGRSRSILFASASHMYSATGGPMYVALRLAPRMCRASRNNQQLCNNCRKMLILSNHSMKNGEPSRTSIASALSWYGSYSTRTHGLPTSESNRVTVRDQPNGNRNRGRTGAVARQKKSQINTILTLKRTIHPMGSVFGSGVFHICSL